MLIMLILLLKTIFALRLTNKAKINSMQKQPHKNGGETYHIKLYNKSEEIITFYPVLVNFLHIS